MFLLVVHDEVEGDDGIAVLEGLFDLHVLDLGVVDELFDTEMEVTVVVVLQVGEDLRGEIGGDIVVRYLEDQVVFDDVVDVGLFDLDDIVGGVEDGLGGIGGEFCDLLLSDQDSSADAAVASGGQSCLFFGGRFCRIVYDGVAGCGDDQFFSGLLFAVDVVLQAGVDGAVFVCQSSVDSTGGGDLCDILEDSCAEDEADALSFVCLSFGVDDEITALDRKSVV